MEPLLYTDLVSFYHLIDPLEDHKDEGHEYGSVLLEAVGDATRLLELGSGAGHGAYYIKTKFEKVTLADLSGSMLGRSKELNPDCEHILGDMRDIRLPTSYDAVLIHDAISYITTPSDLRATLDTVYHHLRLGGAALLVPDTVKEDFKEGYEDHAGDDEHRSLRCLSWSHDPNPADDIQQVDYAFLLRENGVVKAVHDVHTCGLFSLQTWTELCHEAGFETKIVERSLPEEYTEHGYTDKMFLCIKR